MNILFRSLVDWVTALKRLLPNSKIIAAKHYNEPSRRIYGYIYGESGGSFQVAGAMENTMGVWDGGVTYVQALPVSIPNVPVVRALTGKVLRSKAAQIADAV